MAFESGSLIVVPQGISLGPRVALEDVENHILREAQVPGEYYSVNGKKAVIDGSDLCTQEGYAEPRRVRIIVSEEVVDEARHPGKKLQVLLVVRPLEGGVRASENPDELDYESFRKYVTILRLNPEGEAVFHEMDDFVREVNFLGEAAADAFERIKPSLRACVHAKWRSACEALGQLDLLHGCGHVKERHRVEVAQVVETYIMGGIHRVVHRWLRTQHAASLHAFATALDRMQGYSAADMGVPWDFECDVSSAVSELVKLQDPATPLDKILALKAVTLQLYRVVQEHLRRPGPGASVDAALSTDDLVALIAYSIVRAHPHSAGLALDLAYIQDFHFVSTSTSPTGFYLNNFQVAVDYLLSRGEAARRDQVE